MLLSQKYFDGNVLKISHYFQTGITSKHFPPSFFPFYDCVKHWQQVESGKYADKLFWMTNNRKTGRYEQTVSDSNPNSSKTNMTILLPDGVHKIAHDKVKQVPDSLKADTNMLYNLFCNKKLKREKFEGHGVQLDEFKSSTCCV